MKNKLKISFGEICLLIFTILSSFLIFPIFQRLIYPETIINLESYDVGIYILITILPAIFRSIMKTSIQYSTLVFFIFNIVSMFIFFIANKAGIITSVSEDCFFSSAILYVVILSAMQSILFLFLHKLKKDNEK